MMTFERLNPQQRAAVEQTEGPLLILAGAGSGKTRVLTCRVAHLIDKGVRPWKILAITFTNKAAAEMRERVTALAGDAAADVWVSTFHSACARILRRDIEKLGYKHDFTIYDEDDRNTVIRRAIKEMKLDEKEFAPKVVRAMISDAKNRLLTPDEWLQEAGDDFRNRRLAELYKRYEATLSGNNALDFDDLLVKTLVLLAEHPPVLAYYRDKFDYILVDEYQDTNLAQYQLVRQLTGEKRNLCVVGDDDQSIYGWRGADIRNILEFEKDFPDCTVIKLEQNYRSTTNILDAANQVIAHNTGRKEKKLWTDSGEGAKLRLYHAMDERDEADFICRMSRKLISQGIKPGQIAVLYRTNAQSRVLEEEFIRAGVPSRVYGGQRFYDRKEVKDVIAYMRALANPDDDVSVRRVINEPKRGIGDTTVDRLAAYAEENGLSLMSACLSAADAELNKRATSLVDGFAQLMIALTEDMYTLPLTEFVQSVLDKTGYVAALEAEKTDEARDRIGNLEEFKGAVSEYAAGNPEAGAEEFLENVALLTDIDGLNETTGVVTLMTLHSAKGLEFDAVFLAGMEDGVFPLSRATLEESALEEERRLMYVGITRAKKQLFLSHAQTRLLYNARSSSPLSRFVDEIPRRLIEEGSKRGNSYIPRPEQRAPGSPSAPRYGYNAPRSAPPARENTDTDFAVGDVVRHAIFGMGIVTDFGIENGVKKVTIEFATGSKKRFSASVAPIKKIDP